MNSLSIKDQKLLDSFDISIFKSAVAYLQSSRHNSCQPGVVHELKSPGLGKYKNIRDKEPPLLPVESRLASLCQKYVKGSKILKSRTGDEDDLRFPMIDGKQKKREFQKFRRGSIGVHDEENFGRISDIHEKVVKYEKKRGKYHFEESGDEVKTTEDSLQTCENFKDI